VSYETERDIVDDRDLEKRKGRLAVCAKSTSDGDFVTQHPYCLRNNL
jgi:hypothetical protein